MKITRIKYYLKLRLLFAQRVEAKTEINLFRDILKDLKDVEQLETTIRNIEIYLDTARID